METPPAEKLLKKILELEESQKHLKKEMSRLKVTAELRQQSYSVSPDVPARRNIGEGAPAWRKSGAASFRHSGPFKKEKEESCIQSLKNSRAGVDGEESSAKKFTDQQYLNILQSMAQSVHAFDLNMQIIFWNAMSEKLYGYTAEEVVGKNPINVMVDDRDAAFAMNVAQRCVNGESWTGEFPVKTKSGKIFSAVTTCSPFYDDNCSLVGIISITSSSAPFQDSRVSLAQLKAQECETSSISSNNSFASKLGLNTKGSVTSKLGNDSDQPIKVAIASKISYLASKVSKVRSKMRAYDNSATLSEGVFGADHRDDGASTSGASTPRGDFIKFPFGVFTYNDETFPSKPLRESEGESKIRTKDKECMVKKVLSWPWQGNEQESSKRKPTDSAWPWLQNEQEKGKSESCNNRTNNAEASSLWSSSLNMNSPNSFSSCASTSNRFMNKADTYRHCSEYEILWDDLTIGDHIGQGSCGTVYHGVWFGSDVAVKVFSKQEYSEEIIQSFRQEVSMMKRLRHPNVLLFMGAVTSPQRLCTVSEFLPRGSLFRLLQRNTSKLDWRRRIHMALDIARAMNYLHHCSPPIIHRDLKSSNLLVDKNLTVKVADFGLARIKHETYLTTKSGRGTPQWMAPEVLRNESCDEKSDIYSYGVVLWELATEKIPWESLNSMQVIGAVGFMNQRLEIPKNIDPRWISLIKSCWHSDTKLRPTFQELIEELRDLQREYTMKYQATRAWVS